MYKVKFNEAVAGANFSYRPGEEVMLEEAEAKAWAAMGRVKIIDGPIKK
jgi:hypothetical protein